MITLTNQTTNEAIVVAQMMMNPQRCIDYSAVHLTPEDILDPDLQKLFSLLVSRYQNLEPVTPHGLVAQLKTMVGDCAAGMLADLTEIGFDYWHHPFYVKQVLGDSALRQVARINSDVGAGIRDRLDASLIIDETQKRLDAVRQQRDSELSTVYEAGLSFLDDNDSRTNDTGAEVGISQVDRKLGGMHAGELVVVAGRPGSGKSVLGLQVCRESCLQGKSALFVSLEMSKTELTNRLLAGVSQIDIGAIRSKRMDSDEIKAYAVALEAVSDWDLVIADKHGQSLADIRQVARSLKARDRLDIVCVDYIRLIAPSDTRLEMRQHIAQVTQGLKELSKELSVPILALCQMNRETDKLQVPKLSNLADSSSVEQDADIVILLHRPQAAELNFKLIIAKHRHGAPGTVDVELNTSTMMFEVPTEWTP